MPITRIASSSGITSRGPTAADAGFDAALQVRDTIVTAGSTAASTVNDRNITTTSSSTVDRAGDIDVMEIVLGTFTPYLRFESLDEDIATVDSVGNVTRVTDGTATILVKTRLLNKPVSVPVSRTSGQTVVTLNSYVAGSLAKDCSESLDALLAGKTPSTAKPLYTTQDHGTASYVRNTGSWAASLDLTCVSPWNSAGGISYAGTAISPRHIIYARHFPSDGIPDGTTFRFVTADGEVVTRTLSDSLALGGSGYAYDLTIGLLDSALPSTITPAKVLPSSVLDYLPSLSEVYSLPCLVIDREEKALVTDLFSLAPTYATCHVPVDATRLTFYEQLITGDSGNPVFLIINDVPTLVTTLTYSGAGAGPRIHALHSEINAAMATLGGGYSLTDVDLTGFTDFS